MRTDKWERQKTHLWRLSGMMAVALCLGTVGLSRAQEDEVIARGRTEYQQSCAVCHGEQGKGNGSMAELLRTTRPTDLTQIRKTHAGQFPFWRVYRVIDGREEIKGHGTRDMPIWGQTFRLMEGGDEDAVRGRIWQLLYYLQTLQEE
jgi:mono/diheme cytochrome c family protein